jgi:hypothetical protein
MDFRRMGLGAIFYYRQVKPVGDLHDFMHLARLPEDVHGYDGFGLLGDPRLQSLWAHTTSDGLNVGKDRYATSLLDTRHGGYGGMGNGDDFVLGIQA